MKKFSYLLSTLAIFTVSVRAQKISGDVGLEESIEADQILDPGPTVPPSIINIPTINWDDILNNLPTLPPLVLPTIDPNFWKNLVIPTLPPLQIPTLDPNFWQNLPTLPPLVLPTLDPNFWQNLPTIPPLVLPTLDPNFWQNLPTLAPLPTLPTLDPNFWQNLLPTPTPRTSQCTYILAQEIQNNSTFTAQFNFSNVQSTITLLLSESAIKCSGFQTQKLTELSKKYQVGISDLQAVSPYMTSDNMKSILLGVLNADSGSIFQIFFSKTMENIGNFDVSTKLSKASSQISALQFDLLIQPI